MKRSIYSNAERLQILRDTDNFCVKDAARMAGVTTFTIRHWRRNRTKYLSGPPDERRCVEIVPLAQFEAAVIQMLEGQKARRMRCSHQELIRKVKSLSKQYRLRKGIDLLSWIDRFMQRQRPSLKNKLLCNGAAARIPKEPRSTKNVATRLSIKPVKRRVLQPPETLTRMVLRRRMPSGKEELDREPSEPDPTTDTPRSESLSDILLGIADAVSLLSSPLPTHEELVKLEQESNQERRNERFDENSLSPNDIVRDLHCTDASASFTSSPWPFVSVAPDPWTHSSSTCSCLCRYQTGN
ncbi:hypothetical protein TGDOM2_285300 [Toxoplasma gondii GAB2-2007-GAL-DOM2]|uniref:Uncharacterized protein n=4 Tax=Toxoplasma gondii TaxID=5811 RepID=B9QGV6_TOXGV|nr:hypothetical protein TGVEG_285300 [Toxoplasma gondii VEG]KFG39888.1 hypothetical protein TGDOM2_285300 [Toxoplasma gondii GAB2-2007-GAL-DOM2]KFG45117.1 hypothetical protein TGP89_285300 [Toxoplasma gondii p89]KFH08517.1 hypothetical protein TGMAS_285300 [Toxoplasma gondii MAS]